MPSWPDLAAIYHAPTMSLPEAMSGGMNIVIIGQPGIGKTVALAYLASIVANRASEAGELGERVPFLLHVADLHLKSSNPDERNMLDPIIEANSGQVGMLDLARLPGFTRQAFGDGRALLLLDGFDELAPDGQEEISKYLTSLLDFYPRLQVVTTGAPEHLDGLVALNFVPLALIPWDQAQRDRFASKWGQLWMKTVALESWAQTETGIENIDPILLNSWLITGNENLTPFELTLKLWAGYAGDSLGPSVLDAMATHIHRLAPVGTPLAALETLGLQVVIAEQPVFDARGAREWVKSFEPVEDTAPDGNADKEPPDEDKKPKTGPLAKSNKKEHIHKPTSGLLGKMRDSGLLTAHINNRMRFAHPLIGGYLAGIAMTNYKIDEGLLEQPEWVGKLLAMQYLAVHGDVMHLVESYFKTTSMPLHQNVFTVARWLKYAPAKATWRGKVFTKLIEVLHTENIPLTLRAQAMAALVQSGDPNVAELFRQFMNTTSFELLHLLSLGCGAMKDTKAIGQLSGALHAPSTVTQRAACLALVAIGTVSAMETVAHALLQGEEEVRQYAAEAMANDPFEGQAMLKEGLSMDDILLRRAVVFGLKRVKDIWAVQLLESIQLEDSEWVVRNAASEALESMVGTNLHVPRPLPAPSESAWLIEFAGKLGTGISPGSSATDILLAAFNSDQIEEQLAALPYLKQTPSEGVFSSFYHALYSDYPELREAVFVALCELAAGGIKLPHPQQFGLG
jgi:HEAT repeat protein